MTVLLVPEEQRVVALPAHKLVPAPSMLTLSGNGIVAMDLSGSYRQFMSLVSVGFVVRVMLQVNR